MTEENEVEIPLEVPVAASSRDCTLQRGINSGSTFLIFFASLILFFANPTTKSMPPVHAILWKRQKNEKPFTVTAFQQE